MPGAVRISPTTLKAVTATLHGHDRDEMAVPSYSHWNPAIRALFWKRLDTALEFADLKPGDAVLDFGVGSGIMLPSYHAADARIAATDLHVEPARAMARERNLPAEIVPIEAFPAWVDTNTEAIDCIFALDVLEHVEPEELVALSATFKRLLKPGGRLVVSGPTESFMYKAGRAVAGFLNSHYRGEYHHRDIFDIDRELRAQWRVERATWVPRRPLPRAFLLTRYAPAQV
ncbi:MAG: methyltransferase domain-containing protein [Dehalococcoidia bacterium]|nr:methyltransferase domain-containing protein [Dehalococcoidia bacterium]